MMNVTHVSLLPTEQATKNNRPALTPELLAATGARYSRNNEGLEEILSKIDKNNLDKSVDSIFKMIDYGHQSIADMVPVSIFIDGISIFMAYYVWSLCPTAGGQESSTRYINMEGGVIAAEALGIRPEYQMNWQKRMNASFTCYTEALEYWNDLVEKDISIVKIPENATEAQTKRIVKNFAFDRARYFLPVAAPTNMMLVMSARSWVSLCQHLLSHPLKEAQTLGNKIKEELSLVAPRLLKHAVKKESFEKGIWFEYTQLIDFLKLNPSPGYYKELNPTPKLEVHTSLSEIFAEDLTFHENRYDYIGNSLKRTSVRFSWEAVAFAEIRDLNRHRTGNKYCPLIPNGFYFAEDQVIGLENPYTHLSNIGVFGIAHAREQLKKGYPEYIYETFLGTTYYFEHLTTADKFIYEAELRTGLGSHYRYAKHFKDMLELWYEKFPETKELIIEGNAEPE